MSCYETAIKKKPSAGAKKFFFGIGMPKLTLMWATMKARKYAKKEQHLSGRQRIPSKEATDVLILNELLPVTMYEPDLEKIIENQTKIIIGCSEYGIRKDKWYAQIAKQLAEKLSCDFEVFAGHHGSFMDQPEKWAAKLKDVFEKS